MHSQPGLWSCKGSTDKHYGFQNTSVDVEFTIPLHENFSRMGEEHIFVVVQQLGAAQSAFSH